MHEDYRIRPAVAEDADMLAAMAQALAMEEGDESAADARALVRDAFGEAPACRFWVAEAEEVAGFIMGYAGYDLTSAARGWHLGDVYVMPAHRRRGVAAGLVRFLAMHCAREGGEWLSLTRGRANQGAAEFYRALGFVDCANVAFHAIGGEWFKALYF